MMGAFKPDLSNHGTKGSRDREHGWMAGEHEASDGTTLNALPASSLFYTSMERLSRSGPPADAALFLEFRPQEFLRY